MKNPVKVPPFSVRYLQKILQNILKVNKDFLRKLYMLVLFDDIMFIVAIFLIVDHIWFKYKYM